MLPARPFYPPPLRRAAFGCIESLVLFARAARSCGGDGDRTSRGGGGAHSVIVCRSHCSTSAGVRNRRPRPITHWSRTLPGGLVARVAIIGTGTVRWGCQASCQRRSTQPARRTPAAGSRLAMCRAASLGSWARGKRAASAERLRIELRAAYPVSYPRTGPSLASRCGG
jgi:hypothetical protein